MMHVVSQKKVHFTRDYLSPFITLKQLEQNVQLTF